MVWSDWFQNLFRTLLGGGAHPDEDPPMESNSWLGGHCTLTARKHDEFLTCAFSHILGGFFSGKLILIFQANENGVTSSDTPAVIYCSGGSRISHRGRQSHGGANSRGGYISKNLYVKTKESGPFGGMHRQCPLDLPMYCHRQKVFNNNGVSVNIYSHLPISICLK